VQDQRGADGSQSRGGPSLRQAVGMEVLSRRRRQHAHRGGNLMWHSGPRFNVTSFRDAEGQHGDEEGGAGGVAPGSRRTSSSRAAGEERAMKRRDGDGNNMAQRGGENEPASASRV
jgi:hypothetical protein